MPTTVPTVPNFAVSVQGDPKTAKTTFGFTFPDPIYYVLLDRRPEQVLRRFPSLKEITKDNPTGNLFINRPELPIFDTLKPDAPYALPIVNKLKADYKAMMEGQKYKTAIIDTATVLYELCVQAFKEKTLAKGLVPREYGEPYSWMAWFIKAPTFSGMNVVVINHLKDEYVNEKSTGNKVLDGYRRTANNVDVIFRTDFRESDRKFVGTIDRNIFDPSVVGKQLVNPTYRDLTVMLGLVV